MRTRKNTAHALNGGYFGHFFWRLPSIIGAEAIAESPKGLLSKKENLPVVSGHALKCKRLKKLRIEYILKNLKLTKSTIVDIKETRES